MTRQVWHWPSPTACAAMPTTSLMVGTPVGSNLTLRIFGEGIRSRERQTQTRALPTPKRRLSTVLSGATMQHKVNVQRFFNLNIGGKDEHMATSRERHRVLKYSFRLGCGGFRICVAAPRWRPTDLRLPDLQRIFCALRRFDLHADREADHGQNRNRRHCDVPGGGLYVSSPSRPVDC